MWYNADSRENVTQRIVYDADGDGLYNGSEDWDSGEIYQDLRHDIEQLIVRLSRIIHGLVQWNLGCWRV